MTEENLKLYKDSLGYKDGLDYLRQVLLGTDTSKIVKKLSDKALLDQ
jgi:hypothetical protein